MRAQNGRGWVRVFGFGIAGAAGNIPIRSTQTLTYHRILAIYLFFKIKGYIFAAHKN